MLKKIFLTGRLILSPKQKEKSEIELDKPYKNSAYYSLLVKISNGSVTLLRCVVRNEKMEEWSEELKDGDIINVWGLLKNEMKSRQIIIEVNKWEKIDSSFEELDEEKCDFVKLAGEIVDIRESNDDRSEGTNKPRVLSLKVLCSWQRGFDKNNTFFCRVNEDEEISNISIKKGDIIVAAGFLQTKKIASMDTTKIEDRISAIICQRIWVIDNMDDPSLENHPTDIKVYNMRVNKIDFSRPKPNEY